MISAMNKPKHELDDEELLAALKGMPSQRRRILILVNVDGFTFSQAARALDVSVNTIKRELLAAYRQITSIPEQRP